MSHSLPIPERPCISSMLQGGPPFRQGINRIFGATFSNIPPGNDVENSHPYADWCIDANTTVQGNTVHQVDQLYSVYDPFPPSLITKFPYIQTVNWKKIDYILSKKWYWYNQGASYEAIQISIWNLTNHIPVGSEDGVTLNATQAQFVYQILNDANANGTNYQPGCGDPVLILVDLTGRKQMTCLELEQFGTISGHKKDTTGSGLQGWKITLVNKTNGYPSFN